MPDRGTSHGNVKHDCSGRDNTCNNNSISRSDSGTARLRGIWSYLAEIVSMPLDCLSTASVPFDRPTGPPRLDQILDCSRCFSGCEIHTWMIQVGSSRLAQGPS